LKNVHILAIETSCDDTSIAIVKNGNEVVKNLVASQIENFAKLGGVIPEAASRLHFENFHAL
jgi:N6-L-threonylcarbamoyladenine synthase